MDKYKVTVNGMAYEVEIEQLGANVSLTDSTQMNQQRSNVATLEQQEQKSSHSSVNQVVNHHSSNSSTGEDMLAPMQGKIVAIKVIAGQNINKGDVVAVLEAMKMENEIVAPKSGRVISVGVTAGHTVEAGDMIACLS